MKCMKSFFSTISTFSNHQLAEENIFENVKTSSFET